jgi:hypothetical protein
MYLRINEGGFSKYLVKIQRQEQLYAMINLFI